MFRRSRDAASAEPKADAAPRSPQAEAAALLLRPLIVTWRMLVLIAAIWGVLRFGALEFGTPVTATDEHQNIFLVFFRQDLPVGLFLLALTGALWLGLRRGALARGVAVPLPPWRIGVALLALLALGASWLGAVHAHHRHDLLLDEFMPWFQARIFLAGHLLAPIDPAWRDFAKPLQPVFAYIDAERGLWGSAYRPVHAMLRAGAAALGDEALLNPVLAAGSVLLVAHLARVMLPDRTEAPLLAAALLVASPQFLATAASGFSFSAHLFLALLWLALFLRGDLPGHACAALVGAVAIGLHQVHVHPFFAAPFLLAHLFGHYGRSLASLAIYAVVYAVALFGWLAWAEIATAIETGDLSVLPRWPWETLYLRNYGEFAEKVQGVWIGLVVADMPVNMLRFAAWVSPALLMLALLGQRRLRAMPLTVRLAAASFWLTVVAHAVLMPLQMQAWGYRYLHPVLGNLVLLAVAAFPRAGAERAAAGVAVAVFLAASALVLTPWRFAQVEAKIGPRAQAEAFIAGLDADIVIVETRPVWFGADLVRNDPLLRNRPLVMAREALTEAQIEALMRAHRVVTVGPAELARFGLGRGDWIEPVRLPSPPPAR